MSYLIKALWLAVALVVLPANSVKAADQLRIVTTTTTFADLVEQVGGAAVRVDALAPAMFDPHFYDPRPTDIVRLKRADVFVHGGMDLEIWRHTLLDAVGRPELRDGGTREISLSKGITPRDVPVVVSRSLGDVHPQGNPHYYLDPRSGLVMVDTIASRLSEIDPERAAFYHENARAYQRTLGKKLEQLIVAARPIAGLEIIDYHDQWKYLADFLGVVVEQHIEPLPGISPTPRHIRMLQSYIQERPVRLLVRAPYTPTGAINRLGQATGANVAVLCHNVSALDGCESYLAMAVYNTKRLISGLN